MIRCLMFFTAVLAAAGSAAGQEKKQEPEPWYHKLARVLGVDRAPVALKGPSQSTAGELWITPADHAEPRRITDGGGFSSPVFQPGGKYVFALDGAELVRAPVAGGAAVKMRSLPGVVKLVGFDAQNTDLVLAIFKGKASGAPATVDIAMVSVKTGKREMVASRQPADSAEVTSLLAWQRSYGEVYVLPIGNEVAVGGIKAVEIPVTDCGTAVCSQPAYSPELKQVAFVRSGQ